MAKKTVRISDRSGQVIEENQGATVRITYDDLRRGVYELDVTNDEAAEFTQGARKVARRGRRPGTSASSSQASALQ